MSSVGRRGCTGKRRSACCAARVSAGRRLKHLCAGRGRADMGPSGRRLWEAGDRMCGKLLVAVIPDLLAAQDRLHCLRRRPTPPLAPGRPPPTVEERWVTGRMRHHGDGRPRR